MVKRAQLDWPSLSFGYYPTDYNIRYTWRDGSWSKGELTSADTITLHMAATCLHYGQALFEGLKAFETKDGRVLLFRPEENALRMIRGAKKTLMQPFTEELFMEAVQRVVQANRRFVPPHDSGAALYVRPLLIGSGPQVGVKPAEEYQFVVFVTPVGPYFKTGFTPVNLRVEEEVDRAAPLGVGDIKVAGNYAAGIRASYRAKEEGYTEVLYLDAKEKKYIDESGPANFFGITRDDTYVTPHSHSILPSITNMSLRKIAKDFGLRVQERPVEIDEIKDFKEAGCCGTAAVITPVGSITYRGKRYVYGDGKTPGAWSVKMYEHLCDIQRGNTHDTYNWTHEIECEPIDPES